MSLKNIGTDLSSEPLALATLIRKTGSGYRGAGAKKIIKLSEGSEGMLSGGCLETAIEKTARERWKDMPFIASFSTANEEDKIFGYQAGCAGTIDILFEQLPSFSENEGLFLPFGDPPAAAGVSVSIDPERLAQRTFVDNAAACKKDAFFDAWRIPIHLTVIGCGLDATPYGEFAKLLGWTVAFLDFRPSFASSIPGARTVAVSEIGASIATGARSAVVLMTHNFHADLEILAQLISKDLAYLGCLGPHERYLQIKQELLEKENIRIDEAWEKIVHAPAGFETKCRSPSDIALTVIAQIQSVLSGKDDYA